jgi:hypothetical protein
MPCGQGAFQSFRGVYCPHLHGDSVYCMDAEVVGRKACVGYVEKLEDIWSIRTMEGGKVGLVTSQWE